MPPLLVIGLDGASFAVLDDLGARGQLPVLSRLCREGLRAELLSTVPTATLPAWTSFLTAEPPWRHGVTDMLVRHGYGLTPAHGGLRRVPTLLARLSQAGRRVASLGVPGTYPPEQVTGVVVSGFDAPSAGAVDERGVHPRSLWPKLRAAGGWRFGAFNEHRGGGHAEAVRALLRDLDDKERVILELYGDGPWDLFFVHLQASDTAGHHLWHTYDPGSPRHRGGELADALPSVYRRLDALVGRLLARAPAEARVLVVSDHGMGGAADVAVHLNRLLCELGLLRFGAASRGRAALAAAGRAVLGRLPRRLLARGEQLLPAGLRRRLVPALRGQAIDHAGSAAFSDELDYAPSIWLNRRGRFAAGWVDDPEPLVTQLRGALLALRHPLSGEPLVAAVHTPRELGFADDGRCPDLVIEPAWPGGYRPSFLPSPGPGAAVRRLSPREFSAPKGCGMPGAHRRAGVFVAHGPGVPAQELPPFGIAEAGLCAYALAGVAPPAEVATELSSFLRPLCAQWAGDATPQASLEPTPVPRPLAPAEAAVLDERLRALGYIE